MTGNNAKGGTRRRNFPTVSTDSTPTTAKIDAHEGCNVRICGIPGAFLSAEMDEDVKMALSGRLAELMVNIAPQIYRKHVIYEKRRLVLYVTLNTDLYNCLGSTLMFYEWFVADMRGKGFEPNP